MAREDYSYENARRREFANLTRTAVMPAAALVFLLKVTKVQLGYYTVPCYGLCILLGSYLQGACHALRLGRDAKRLTAGKKGPVGSIPVWVPPDISR